jgi:leucyl/phenylalanyl-tRNA--protein transferase
MFHRQPDASKVALVALVRRLTTEGVGIIDCQIASEHLVRLGAREISRSSFLHFLRTGRVEPAQPGPC